MAEIDRISELYEELSGGGENFLTKAYLDYLENNADLKSVQALTTASEFIPGISTALAKRRDDKFGEALSYLDYLGPGGAAVKMMAIPAKSAINVGRQRFMLDPKWVGRKTTTRSNHYVQAGTDEVSLPARQVSRQPYYPKEAKNIPDYLTSKSYPGPTRSVEEGLGSLIPVRKNLPKGSREHKWYIDPKTGKLFEYNYGSGVWARGFYKRGAQSQNTPAYARKAREDFLRRGGVRTPQQQISSLQHQLHRKMSERNQEGHLMSTYNLTKITNEIDALEARIAALTLKIGK